MHNQPRTLNLLLHAALGGAIGYLAWGHPEFTWVAGLLPALWSRSDTRTAAWILVFVYQLAGSRVIPQGAAVFFGDSASLAGGIILWIAAAAANSLPWAVLWVHHNARNRALLMTIACVGALFIGMVPPLGIIGWLNPLIAAATLFPGYGFLALFSAMLILCGTVATVPLWKTKAWTAFLVAICLLGAVSNALDRQRASLDSWVAIDTKVGPYPKDFEEIYKRKRYVVTVAEEQIGKGASVVVFPEQLLGLWNDIDTRIFLNSMFEHSVPATHSILVGAERKIGVHGHLANSVFIYNNGAWQWVDARQTVPVSMWRPWDDKSFPADWTRINVLDIAGKRVALSICYEDFLAPLHLAAFIIDTPEAIISVSNSWWTRGTDEITIQQQHIDAIARIFGVPLISAKNVG